MYFLSDPLVEYAVEYFKKMDCADPAEGDTFWRLFSPGNTLPHSDRPFERLSDYEEMLGLLARTDPKRYEQLHKGTPFYFMSWLAFDLRIYKKALFYIDAAISEDVRQAERSTNPNAWKTLPGAKFMLLQLDEGVAQRAIRRVLNGFSCILLRFNRVSNKQNVGFDELMAFVNNFLSDSMERTVISGLYARSLPFRMLFERRCKFKLRLPNWRITLPRICSIFRRTQISAFMATFSSPRLARCRPALEQLPWPVIKSRELIGTRATSAIL